MSAHHRPYQDPLTAQLAGGITNQAVKHYFEVACSVVEEPGPSLSGWDATWGCDILNSLRASCQQVLACPYSSTRCFCAQRGLQPTWDQHQASDTAPQQCRARRAMAELGDRREGAFPRRSLIPYSRTRLGNQGAMGTQEHCCWHWGLQLFTPTSNSCPIKDGNDPDTDSTEQPSIAGASTQNSLLHGASWAHQSLCQGESDTRVVQTKCITRSLVLCPTKRETEPQWAAGTIKTRSVHGMKLRGRKCIECISRGISSALAEALRTACPTCISHKVPGKEEERNAIFFLNKKPQKR